MAILLALHMLNRLKPREPLSPTTIPIIFALPFWVCQPKYATPKRNHGTVAFFLQGPGYTFDPKAWHLGYTGAFAALVTVWRL